MNTPADNPVPSYLVGDPTETLLNIKSRGDDSETGTWLASLVNDALEIAAHGDAEQPVTDADLDLMVRWVAEIFNEFELYKIEFNKKAVGSDLIVDASPLNLDALSPSHDHFEAHLSTRHWSLAFDASTRKLDVYLIPAEFLLAFTTSHDQSQYKPFLTFIPRRHRDQYYWSVEDRTVTFELLPKLAKELFSDLIKVASGNISEEEFFSSAPNGVAEAAQRAAEIATTDRSYDVDRYDSIVPVANDALPSTFGNQALTDLFFARCAEFSSSLESEMQAVIEYAKIQPNNVEVLQNCKKIITELDSLRTVVNDVSSRLRQIP